MCIYIYTYFNIIINTGIHHLNTIITTHIYNITTFTRHLPEFYHILQDH